jgi:hypothetical protein
MTKLYGKQLHLWNEALLQLGVENAYSLNKNLGIVGYPRYTIYYHNRTWKPVYLNWLAEEDEEVFGLDLNPAFPEYEKRMSRIAEELTELEDEKYEVERFVSGLVLFNALPKAYAKILGRTLYAAISVEIEQHCASFTDVEWETGSNKSLETYANNNKYIITAMNERLMMNLITLDG